MQLFIDSNHLSPYAMSVFVALREKGISFEKVLINLQAAEHLAANYAGVSTTQRVPTINDNGFHLSESSAICEYLEEKFPGLAIYPKSVEQRAKAREIQAWLRSDLMANLQGLHLADRRLRHRAELVHRRLLGAELIRGQSRGPECRPDRVAVRVRPVLIARGEGLAIGEA